MISDKNYSGNRIINLKEINDDETFERCNFSRHILGSLLTGIKGIIYKDCNLSNCIIESDSKIEGKRYGVNKSKCKHLHPEITELANEVENCEHVIDSDEIYVDGILADTIYYYEDTII